MWLFQDLFSGFSQGIAIRGATRNMFRRLISPGRRKRDPSVLLAWDYRTGISGKFEVIGASPIHQQDGLLLQSDAARYTTASIVPNIPALTGSYRATITYSELTVPDKYGGVFFGHFNDEKPLVCYGYYMRDTAGGYFKNADGKSVLNLFTPTTAGRMVIEYDAAAETITFIQGNNRYSAALTDPSASVAFARLLYVQTGSGTDPSSVKLQNIRIERMEET